MSLELEDQYDKIYRYCYFRVKDARLAEDLTQEAFLRFFSQKTYISRGKPLAYLYAIAKNLCIDAYNKTETISLPDDFAEEDRVHGIEANIAINQALDALPQDLREIILLRHANDLQLRIK